MSPFPVSSIKDVFVHYDTLILFSIFNQTEHFSVPFFAQCCLWNPVSLQLIAGLVLCTKELFLNQDAEHRRHAHQRTLRNLNFCAKSCNLSPARPSAEA